MSNRSTPSNDQPGEPGWTARQAPSARPVSPGMQRGRNLGRRMVADRP
jgi:hypothetical protein